MTPFAVYAIRYAHREDSTRAEHFYLGDSCGDPGDATVMATTIETAVHLHPPIGLTLTAPNAAVTVRSARWAAEA